MNNPSRDCSPICAAVRFIVVALATGLSARCNAVEAPAETLPYAALVRLKVSDSPNFTNALFSPDGKLLLASDVNRVGIWNVATGKKIHDLDGREIRALSPDGNFLACGVGHDFKIFNLSKEPPSIVPTAEKVENSSTVFSPDGKFLANATYDNAVVIWSTESEPWKPVRKLLVPARGGNVFGGIAISPDNKILAASVGGVLCFFDPASGDKLFENKDFGGCGPIAFSPDGSTLACADYIFGTKKSVHLIDVASRKQRSSFPIEFGPYSIAYFPDGKLIAYRESVLIGNGVQGALRICDAESGAQLVNNEIEDSKLSNVAISPDGRTVAAGNDKSVVILWDVGRLILKDEKIPVAFKLSDLEELWQSMGGKDPVAACRATWKLAASGNVGVSFLKTRLRIAPKNQAHIDKLIEALDNENAGIRAAARDDVIALADQVQVDLRKVADGPQTPHSKSEARAILMVMELSKAPAREKTPEEQQQTRAILALGLIGTPEAIELLRTAAGGASQRTCWEAKQALERLSKSVTYASPSATSTPPPEKTGAGAEVATTIAKTAADLNAKGRVDAARSLLLRALCEDERCATALYELGIILQSQGDPAASEFLSRAVTEMTLANNPEFSAKLVDAQARLPKTNPYSAQLTTLLDNYAEELGRISKRAPDAGTIGEVLNRATALDLSKTASASKLPTAPAPTKPEHHRDGNGPVVDAIPADIVQTLKNAGWTTIKGQWKKLPNGAYEVTDGKLECAKVNGIMQLWIYKGGAGTVKALVRNDQKNFPWSRFGKYYHTDFELGYGIAVTAQDCQVFLPLTGTMAGWTGPDVYPYRDHTTPLSDLPKHLILVSVQDSALEVFIDNKSDRKTSYKISKDGPFTIEIKGTMTIEDPKVSGQ